MNILLGNPLFSDWNEPISRLGRENIYIEDLDNVDKINSVIASKDIKLIIPLTFDQMRFMIENTHKIKTQVICSQTYDAIDQLDDKCSFIKFILNNYLSDLIPKVYIVIHNGNIHVQGPIKTYPIIFKYGYVCAGSGSKVCLSVKDLSRCTEESQGYNFVVQEYIEDNTEYSAHVFVVNGQVKHAIYYKTIHQEKYYIQCGKMKEYTRELNFKYETEFDKIFGLLNYTGFACVDFKVVDNQVKIFEINPRFGGTLIHNRDGLNEMLDKVTEYYLSSSPANLV